MDDRTEALELLTFCLQHCRDSNGQLGRRVKSLNSTTPIVLRFPKHSIRIGPKSSERQELMQVIRRLHTAIRPQSVEDWQVFIGTVLAVAETKDDIAIVEALFKRYTTENNITPIIPHFGLALFHSCVIMDAQYSETALRWLLLHHFSAYNLLQPSRHPLVTYFQCYGASSTDLYTYLVAKQPTLPSLTYWDTTLRQAIRAEFSLDLYQPTRNAENLTHLVTHLMHRLQFGITSSADPLFTADTEPRLTHSGMDVILYHLLLAYPNLLGTHTKFLPKLESELLTQYSLHEITAQAISLNR